MMKTSEVSKRCSLLHPHILTQQESKNAIASQTDFSSYEICTQQRQGTLLLMVTRKGINLSLLKNGLERWLHEFWWCYG